MSGVTLHVSLIDRGAGRAELRYWQGHPNQHTPRPLALDDIQDLILRTEADYYARGIPDLVDVGR